MIERTTIVFEHELLEGLEHPAFIAQGKEDGPRVSLIGGIHGCEYSSIAAVTRFMNELDTSELRGTIEAVPVVSMESFRQRSPFVVPVDGKNLNRCFPGSYDGTYTEVLARSIFDRLIEPADVLLDLHGGDQVEALEPFAIYDVSTVEKRAHEIAVAFNLPYVIREEPAGGRPRRDDDERRRAGGDPGRDRRGGRPRAARGERDADARRRACATYCGSWGCCRAIPSRRQRVSVRSEASSGCARRRRGGGTGRSRRATRSPRGRYSGGFATCGVTCARRSSRRRTEWCCSSRQVRRSRQTGCCSGLVPI